MEYRKLGNTGLKVSEVGVGCNNFGMRMDQEQTQAVVDKAIDEGINLFDTADVYGGTKSELFLGNALGSRRHDVVVATKFGMGSPDAVLARGGSRRYIMNAVAASLKRLDTDYIDLYQIHFPDVDTPIEETLRAMCDLVTQGKVRYIGCSNFTGWQIADADWTAKSLGLNRFETAQNLYSLMDRRLEREVIPACERFGLGMLPYFPLASGLLTGKYRRGEDAPEGTRLAAMGSRAGRALSDQNFDVVEKLTDFAETRGHTLLELAIGWLASKPVISSVIAGATKPEQVEANVKASAWKLTAEEMDEVNEISRH
ncbi:MAG: aldo/keto reductase [Pseudomonadales bacterium]|nr:aldo/keto reductase [Gammaproteobacteria bacterium]